jgi:thiol-disulfide isomerase/thioredoxin
MTLNRRAVLTGFAATIFMGSKAHASLVSFDTAAFNAAQDAGKSVVLNITAKWCGSCQKQRPVVAALLNNPEFAHLTVFDADYDLHKNELRKLNAQQLTTLIIYRGRSEVARSSGETRPEMVAAFLKKAL